MSFHCSEPFSPRDTEFIRYLDHCGWRLKCYSIVYDGVKPFDETRFDAALQIVLNVLPVPAVTPHRYGVGILIMHQGCGADYLVLGWWDRENELPLRIFLRDVSAVGGWRAAWESESICVWDLNVIWHDRNAYARHVLSPNPDADAYLRATEVPEGACHEDTPCNPPPP